MNRNRRQVVFYGMFAFLGISGLLIGSELMGKVMLWRRGGLQPYALFYQPPGGGSAARARSFPLIDPLLGWGRSPPFATYYSGAVPAAERDAPLAPGGKRAGTRLIVTLGGSTTDAQLDEHNWSEQVAEHCGRVSLRCRVLNGGISGYASPQELLKLARDVVPLQPDLVIGLDGINDEVLPIQNGRSFVNVHQAVIEQGLRASDWDSNSPLADPPPLPGLFPHARLLFEVARFALRPRNESRELIGIEDGFTAAHRWVTDVRMMHALAQEFGFRYFVFLQPHLGLHPALAAEKLRRLGARFPLEPEKLAVFYAEARSACSRLSYCADISEDLSARSELFHDIYHLTTEGHRLEGERIFGILRERGLL